MKNRTTVWMVVLLAGATLFTYGNSMLNGFVWDDHDIIVNNPVNRDFSNIVSLFSSADSTVSGNQKAYYRPVNRLTYVLDYQMFGLNPAGYHLENIVIHLLTVILLFLMARQLFAKTAPAFIAALLFAVHPVNAEAVNFLSARNSLLAGFFVLLTVLVYLQAEMTNRKQYYYLSGLFFFLGLLCKEQVFMLPLVLLVYELARGRPFMPRMRERIFTLLPFVLTAVIYLVLRTYALSSVIGVNQPLQGVGERLWQNIYIIPKYAAVILFPLRLNALYSVPKHYGAEMLWLVPLWIVLIAAFLIMNKKNAAAKFGLIWLAVNFIPISNVIPIPSAPMAERYLYLPAMGLWLVVADQACRLYERFSHGKTLIAAGAVIVLFFVLLTVYRNADWKDNLHFYARMAETNPDSALAHFSLGLASREHNDLARARTEWKRTAEIDPGYFHVLGYLGESYLLTNSLEQAEYYFAREVEVQPDDTRALFNLAVIEEKLNKPAEALRYYERILSQQAYHDANLIERVKARIALIQKSSGVK